ncbi:MAG: DNA polymerase III subunit delta' [Planctomycetota bacterium]
MSIRSIPGQDHVADMFERIFERDRLGHAYIFAGPKGVGKSLFARELAKALLCEKSKFLGCDECSICRRVDSRNHPDVHWHRPPEGKRIFPIDVVRDEIIPTMGVKAFEGGYKVFILEEAHMMNEEAANCLLKTLEEPPERSLLILITSAPNRLLPTILSRCQMVRFRAIPPDVLTKQLMQALEIKREEAENLAHLSGGSLAAALALHETGGIELKNSVTDRVIKAGPSDNFAVADELIAAAPSKATLDEKREYLFGILNFLLFYYRDMLVSACGGDVVVLNRDRVHDIFERGQRLGRERIERIIHTILKTQEVIFLNANLDLALGNMMTDLAGLQRTG